MGTTCQNAEVRPDGFVDPCRWRYVLDRAGGRVAAGGDTRCDHRIDLIRGGTCEDVVFEMTRAVDHDGDLSLAFHLSGIGEVWLDDLRAERGESVGLARRNRAGGNMHPTPRPRR